MHKTEKTEKKTRVLKEGIATPYEFCVHTRLSICSFYFLGPSIQRPGLLLAMRDSVRASIRGDPSLDPSICRPSVLASLRLSFVCSVCPSVFPSVRTSLNPVCVFVRPPVLPFVRLSTTYPFIHPSRPSGLPLIT